METNAAKPKTRRRWHQYGLRALMICVMIVGVAFAMTASSRRQRSLVAILENNGGDVRYDNGDGWSDSPRGPEWLRDILGDGLFDRPRNVFFLANFDDTIPEEVLLAITGCQKTWK
jgi:hypothetical protein